MKAIQLERPGCFRRVETPEARRPEPGEVLVRVCCVGICGTDFAGFLGKMPFYSYPRIPGHELGVEVIEISDRVDNVSRGDLCAVEPYLNCERCPPCRNGRGNCCEQLEVLGIMIDGGLTERLVVPARKLHRSTSLAPEQCALVETLAIGCHAVNRANVQPDDHVLVIGAGPIGLAVIEFVRLARARTIVMDVNPARLEFVREKIGIPETILPRGHREDLAALGALTGRALPDVVIDATGNERSMSRAVEFVAFGGRLVFVGITPNPLMLDDANLHRRELTVLASRNALPEDFSRIVKLIEMGRLDTRPWITHRASFDGMIDVFPDWLRPGSGVVKAVVEL